MNTEQKLLLEIASWINEESEEHCNTNTHTENIKSLVKDLMWVLQPPKTNLHKLVKYYDQIVDCDGSIADCQSCPDKNECLVTKRKLHCIHEILANNRCCGCGTIIYGKELSK